MSKRPPIAELLVLTGLVVLGLIAAFWLFPSASQDTPPAQHINLEQRSGRLKISPPLIDPGPKLRMAVAPVIAPERSLELYRPLALWLAHRLGRVAEFVTMQSYGGVNDLLRSERVDLAFICTYAFVRGERDFGVQLLVAPQVGGRTTYNSYFIVRPGQGWRSLRDLRGRRFAHADILSTTGYLYPTRWLQVRGEDPQTFFSHQLMSGSHDRSFAAVASGLVDGAAIDSLVYDAMIEASPELAERVEVIHRSPDFGMPPMVVPSGADPKLVAAMRRVLLSMHLDPEGAALLRSLGIDRFVVPKQGAYDGVRALVDQRDASL